MAFLTNVFGDSVFQNLPFITIFAHGSTTINIYS